jgi:hypothetical protein
MKDPASCTMRSSSQSPMERSAPQKRTSPAALRCHGTARGTSWLFCREAGKNLKSQHVFIMPFGGLMDAAAFFHKVMDQTLRAERAVRVLSHSLVSWWMRTRYFNAFWTRIPKDISPSKTFVKASRPFIITRGVILEYMIGAAARTNFMDPASSNLHGWLWLTDYLILHHRERLGMPCNGFYHRL